MFETLHARVVVVSRRPTESGMTMYVLPTNIMVTNKGVVEAKGVQTTDLDVTFDNVTRQVSHMQYVGWYVVSFCVLLCVCVCVCLCVCVCVCVSLLL